MKRKFHLQTLDAIRGCAALYVMLGHSHHLVSNHSKLINLLFSFGQEAVIVFFILSGFVIYLSCYTKYNLSFKEYFLKRFTRIYFPFFVALIVSILIFIWNGNLLASFSWQNLIGNLLMLQDTSLKPGNLIGTFLGNTSLWSLSYEWWFYMMFFPLLKLKQKHKKYSLYIITLFSCCCWLLYLLFPHKILLTFSYFIIWWSGVELAKLFLEDKRINFRNTSELILCLMFITTLTLIPMVNAEKIINYGVYPFLIFRHFVMANLIIVCAIIWYNNRIIFLEKVLKLFTQLSPISYSLYILHYPVLVQWNWNNNFSSIWVTYILKIIILLSLCYLVEIKWQKVVNQIIYNHALNNKIA